MMTDNTRYGHNVWHRHSPYDRRYFCPFFLSSLTPAYLHNPHILTGYRVYFTQRLALLSLFRWHNETLNVWTHFLPWIIFMLRYGAWMMKMMTGNEANDSLVDGVVDTSSTSIPTEWVDYLMFSIFYLSLILCMFWSSIYHLLGCCTYDLHQCLYRCDIGGILVLIWGSYIPALYYAFRCRAELQWIYCTIITLLVVILAINFNLPHCQQRRFHSLRVGSLVLTIAFAILPTFHWIGWVHEKDYPQVPLETFITPLAGMLGSYMIGFIFYSQHIPERWSRNGRFDFIGQSHNWWHLWIVIAATIWESELQSMWKQRGMANCGGI